MEVYSFGPVKEYPLRLGPKIELWPARIETIERSIRDEAWLTEGNLDVVSGWSKGLPAVEYLIFGDEESESILLQLTNETSRCEYLKLLTFDIFEKFTLLSDAWAPDGGNYAEQLIAAGGTTSSFSSVTMAFDEVLNRVGFLIEFMRQMKVAAPSGLVSGTTDLDALESRFCDCALGDLKANLEGVKSLLGLLFVASPDGDTPPLLGTDSARLETELEDTYREIESCLAALEPSLSTAIASGSSSPVDLYNALTRLQVLLQVDLFQALGVTLTFNDNDGD